MDHCGRDIFHSLLDGLWDSFRCPYMVGQAIDDLGAGITREKIIYYPLVILFISLMSGDISISVGA